MLKIAVFIIYILISTTSYAKDKIESTKLSSSEIEDFIEKERKILRGKHKVDLPLNFKKKSSIYAQRYGNTKKVLNLNGISLSGYDLRGVIFTMSSMIKSNLNKADLQNSDFVYVDFRGADLRNANFEKADLSNAMFEGAKLKGANFKGANLFGAEFIKIGDLSAQELKNLKRRTNSYVNLERESLPDYYNAN